MEIPFGRYYRMIVVAAFVVCSHLTVCEIKCESAQVWSIERQSDRGAMQISLRGKPFISYSFRDSEIPRPYFANAFSPNGAKITRNHPPAADDPQDHHRIHPGMWLAFGDISGADNWRLAAAVKHVRFVSEPRTKNESLTFAVENRYLSNDGRREICREACNYTFVELPNGVVVHWDSMFHSDRNSFVFGDQEELGLGVRLAKSVAVNSGLGGRILNSNGQKNESQAWGQQADWCDYSGLVDGQFVGIMIIPHPENFRKAWCHARNTGFMAMNPFGRNAFTGGNKSAVVVPVDQRFRLRYAVLFHWNDQPDDFNPEREYQEYLKSIGN
jgi:hypothetical protein